MNSQTVATFSSRSSSRPVFALLLASLVACGDAAEGAARQESDATKPAGRGSTAGGKDAVSTSDGASAATDGADTPDTTPGGGGAKPGACPDVAGSWDGPVSGLAMAKPSDPEPTQPIDGTANVTFAAGGAAGDFTISDGQFDVSIDMGGLLGKVRAKQKLTGEVKCGKLNGIATGNGLISKLSGTATCTFDKDGCKGEFVVNDGDGNLAARGQFELRK